MAISNKVVGIFGLTLSFLWIGYLFVRLILIPILPLEKDNLLNLQTAVNLLLTCALTGLIFIGSLSGYTLYMMYQSNVTFRDIRNFKLRKNYVKNKEF